jgi:Holliday junction resolvase RusA-like endonuclease
LVKEITLKFEMRPVPKGRPRFARGRVFTPKSTSDFERAIRRSTKLQLELAGMGPLAGTLDIGIIFEYKRPKQSTLPVPRADLDNLIKAVLDGLNEIAFVDDKQVALISAYKKWSDKDLITVTISELS